MTWPVSYYFMVVAAYLLGSIPFGLMLTRFSGLGDIRAIGSGNIGATNVLRTGNKKLALATLLLDGAKGAVAVLLAHALGMAAIAPLAGAAAVIGHIFPVWLKFKGGKGVATALGVMLALHWQAGMIACAAWVAVFFFTRYSSLSSLAAMATGSMAAYLLAMPFIFYSFLSIATLVVLRHHQNIKRLLKGDEPKSSFRKQP